MGVELEWLKQAVSLCMMTTEQQEPEKKEGFQALEQRFLDFSEIEKEQIRNLLKTQFEVRDGMYMLSNFIRYMKIQGFEDDILELMIQGEFDCYLVQPVRIHCKGKVIHVLYPHPLKFQAVTFVKIKNVIAVIKHGAMVHADQRIIAGP